MRTKRLWTLTRGALTALGLVTVTSRASAQDVTLNRFDQPVAGDTFLSVFGPTVGGHLQARGMVTFDYANQPFVAKNAAGEQLAVLSKSQTFLHAGVSLPLWNRLLVSVDMPFALSQRGDDLKVGNTTVHGTHGSGLGELRVGLRARLYGDRKDPFAVGLGGFVYIPTATNAWTGESYTYGEPQLLLGGRIPHFTYGAFVGAKLRRSEDPTSLTFGAGAAALLLDEKLTIGPELRGSYDLSSPALVANLLPRNETTSAEARLGAQYRFLGDFVLGAAGGIGIAQAIGTPDVRALARFAYDPQTIDVTPPADRDHDGIEDEVDACPNDAGLASADPKKHGCPPPPPDTDKDGIIDALDACPAQAGEPNADPKKNGCPPPPDADNDGFIDAVDQCPAQAGTAPDGCPDVDGDGVKDAVDACPKDAGKLPNGCPDVDGDSIADKDDACPNVAGSPSPNPQKNGCPKAVLSAKEIVINDTIEFEVGKAVLLPSSAEIIDVVVSIMKDNDDILSIEVQGHTDDTGSAAVNRKLSQDRAKAVLEAMVAKGIAKPRLVAKGYGPDKPLVKDKTDEARAKNRRVQFVILKRDEAKAKAKAAALEAAKDQAAGAAAKPAEAPKAAPAAEAPKAAPAPAKQK